MCGKVFYLIKNFATAHLSLFVIDAKKHTCQAIIFIRVSYIDKISACKVVYLKN